MMSHDDRSHGFPPKRGAIQEMFMSELEKRANVMKEMEQSKITFGANGEPILGEWDSNGVHVRHMPDDPQGILRISVGGGDHLPLSLNYLTFRGDKGRCVDLLRKALTALEADGE